MYMGLEAEDNETKRLFILSLSPDVLTIASTRDPEGGYFSWEVLERIAKENIEMLERANPRKAQPAEAAAAEEEDEDSSDEELAYINKGKYRPRKKHIGPPNKFNKRSPIKCFAAQCPVNPHSSFYHGPRRSQFKKHNLGYIGNKNDKKAINLLSIGSRGFFLPFHGLTHNCFSGIYA